jgi:NADP-dependent 3-hydroxy acid dehydrogenase YdfG
MSDDMLSIYHKGKHDGREESSEKLKAYQKDHERIEFLVNNAGLSRVSIDNAMKLDPLQSP